MANSGAPGGPGSSGDALYRELWHACAGPLVTVPRQGERVYYFPQGHMEQLEASTDQQLDQHMPLFNLPSKILCKVVNVELRAETDSDEVYAQIMLQPEADQTEPTSADPEPHEPEKCNAHSFCKTLTASDTSTHGGFSVLRRHAEECLPPLDMTQNPPWQELVAKDLHANEWHFRHIFRGQPRRHLLTTGWSVFVSSKRLVAGLLLPSRRNSPAPPPSQPAMVSDASKKKAAQKKAAAAAKRGAKVPTPSSTSSSAKAAADALAAVHLSDRTCTAVLTSHPLSRDIHIESLTLTFHGHDLLVDTELELNYGRRYGLLGLNGCGKSCLLKAIGCRELPIPQHMDIYHLSHEIEASDMSALGAVISCDEERVKLEKEAEILAAQDDGGGEALERVYERLEAIDASTAEKRAAEILFGLGFNKQMQVKKTRDFSGGWRMRIALARALFMNPTILLLDEPTNHLDLEACVWLEETLKKFDRILVVISHSQDFLNGVCTNIIHMQNRKLKLYTGNFDQYIQTRSELEENQMKQYRWEQDQISAMKEYIARFGHGSAKLARQAQSKEKTLAKMERGGLTEKVARDRILTFRFTNVGKLPPPVLQFVEVTFGYTPENLIYKKLDFGVDLDSRVALVGPNGAGKSTLLKLMTGELVPLDGMVRRHNHLRIAQFHQHLAEKLDLELSALQYMLNEYPGNEEERMRAAIGRFGLSGKAQVMPMRNLSDGQRSRVIFAWLAWREPQLLLLDEPTNHLDIETIDSLAEALREWDGGLVLVSHDFRLINQVAEEIWVCENQAVTRWGGDIMEFKEHLRSNSGLSED